MHKTHEGEFQLDRIAVRPVHVNEEERFQRLMQMHHYRKRQSNLIYRL